MAKKSKELSLHFLSFDKLKEEDSRENIKNILDRAKKGQIVVIEGTLSPVFESNLIESTMQNVSTKFSGIEIASITVNKRLSDGPLGDKMKEFMLSKLGGGKRGLTVVGPANVIKKIKSDPENIILQMKY